MSLRASRLGPPSQPVLGLDPGPRCGAAWLRRGAIVTATWNLERRSPGEAWHDFLSELEGLRPGWIVFPVYPPARGHQGAGAQRADVRTTLRGFLDFYAFKHGAELDAISTSALRTYATGRAHADPRELQAAAREHLELLRPDAHAATAAWALRWALERCGRAQPMAQQRQEAGRRVNGHARLGERT